MSTTPNFGIELPTVGASSDTWGDTNNALHNAWDSLLAGPFRNYIDGLALSTAGASATFGVAAGSAADSTNVDALTVASAITKTTSAWAVGSGNGALDTGVVANNTWYHVFLIKRTDTDVVDAVVSLSPSTPTMPSGYTLKRRIGSMLTDGSGNWRKFVQIGDRFLWSIAFGELSAASIGTAPSTRTLGGVPPGVAVIAQMRWLVQMGAPGNNTVVTVFSPYEGIAGTSDITNNAWSFGSPPSTSQGMAASIDVLTNTSAQVKYLSNVTSTDTVSMSIYGWIDFRGRNS